MIQSAYNRTPDIQAVEIFYVNRNNCKVGDMSTNRGRGLLREETPVAGTVSAKLRLAVKVCFLGCHPGFVGGGLFAQRETDIIGIMIGWTEC